MRGRIRDYSGIWQRAAETGLARLLSACALVLLSAAAQAQQQLATDAPPTARYEESAQGWAGLVPFEPGDGAGLGPDARVGDQYAPLAGGIRFDENRLLPVIQVCAIQTRADTACRLRAGADGSHAALAGQRGGEVFIDVGQPVAAASIALAPANPTPNVPRVLFTLEALANGDTAEIAQGEWIADRELEGSGWITLTVGTRTRGTRAGGAADLSDRFERLRVSATTPEGRPINGLLMDRVQILRAAGPEEQPSTGTLAAAERARAIDPRRGEIVQRADTPPGNLYPLAERRRLPVDWEAGRRLAEDQRTGANADLPLRANLPGLNAVGLPVLAPRAAFRDGDPSRPPSPGTLFVAQEDFYHLSFDTPDGVMTVSGTRLMTVPTRADTTPGNLEIAEGWDGAQASFTLFGLPHAARLTCAGLPGERCRDTGVLRERIDDLLVFIGDGEGAP